MPKPLILLSVFLLFCFAVRPQKPLPYQNASLSVQELVDDLINRIDLSEKCNQLQSRLVFLPNYIERRDYLIGNFRNIAHFLRGKGPANPGTCAAAINKDTHRPISAGRFGIPVLQHGEALHGAQWGMATVSDNASDWRRALTIAWCSG